MEGEGEGAYLGAIFDGLVDDVMVIHDLFLCRVNHILETRVGGLEVDVTKATVKQRFAGIQLVFQAELLVVDILITAKVEKGIVKVRESLFKVAREEVRDAGLEVGDGEVLVELDGAGIVFDGLVVLPESCADDTAVEEDLGGIGDRLERLNTSFKLVAIVVGEGGDPGLKLLRRVISDVRVVVLE